MRREQILVWTLLVLVSSISLSLQQTCSPTQLKCTSGECVDRTSVCDYFNDCVDGSDEANCSFSPVDKTKALVLLYALQGASPPILLINWFGDPSQYVPRLGFTNAYPPANLSLPINFDGITSNTYNYISTIDADYYDSRVFFGNNAYRRIEWGAFIRGDLSVSYISGETTSTQIVAIAYDWIAKRVYWLDASYQWIKSASIGQPSEVIIKTVVRNIINPKDIAVDPLNKVLFWISGTCGNAQIMRSDLEGSNPTSVNVVPAPNNNCPIKLTLDVKSQQLYWLDAANARVGYVSYTGNSSASLKSNAAFGAMSSITTFGNYLVLCSTIQKSVNFYKKDTLEFVASSVPFIYPLVDVATYDIVNQPDNGSPYLIRPHLFLVAMSSLAMKMQLSLS